MSPDICICTRATPYLYIPLNAYILREALLKNPKQTEILLGIKVERVTEVKQEEYETPVAEEVETPVAEERPKGRNRGAKE